MLTRLFIAAFTAFSALLLPATAFADHAWGGYHWARTANPFTVTVGDNVSSAWDSYLRTAATDWSVSTVLDTKVAPGKGLGFICRASAGRVEVCNWSYGRNGWLGIAQIWVSGVHITKGAVKLNDYYFKKAPYNTPAWRATVTCQEVGHILGLDHQDEDFANTPLGSCMDYSADPTLNQHPNQHDYDELVEIYTHLDSLTTLALVKKKSAAATPGHSDIKGRLIHKFGKHATFERSLGHGQKVITHVLYK